MLDHGGFLAGGNWGRVACLLRGETVPPPDPRALAKGSRVHWKVSGLKKKTRICIVLILLVFVKYSLLLPFLSRRSLNKCAYSPLTTKLCCFGTQGTRRGHSSGRRGDRGGLST
jgi:hypothetical protein